MENRLFSDRRTVRRAFRCVLVLCLTAILFAALLISVVNDLYAFIKPERDLALQIDSPRSLREISLLFEQEGLIANPTIFSIYVRFKGKAEMVESFVGSAYLSSSMSYREILYAMSQSSMS